MCKCLQERVFTVQVCVRACVKLGASAGLCPFNLSALQLGKISGPIVNHPTGHL